MLRRRRRASSGGGDLVESLALWRRRVRRSRAVAMARRAAVVVLGGAALVALLRIAVGGWPRWIVLVGAAAGLAAALALGARAATSTADAARLLDRDLGLADRLGTAVDPRVAAGFGAAGSATEASSAVLRLRAEAAALAGGAAGEWRARPRPAPREWLAVTLGAVGVAALLALPSARGAGARPASTVAARPPAPRSPAQPAPARRSTGVRSAVIHAAPTTSRSRQPAKPVHVSRAASSPGSQPNRSGSGAGGSRPGARTQAQRPGAGGSHAAPAGARGKTPRSKAAPPSSSTRASGSGPKATKPVPTRTISSGPATQRASSKGNGTAKGRRRPAPPTKTSGHLPGGLSLHGLRTPYGKLPGIPRRTREGLIVNQRAKQTGSASGTQAGAGRGSRTAPSTPRRKTTSSGRSLPLQTSQGAGRGSRGRTQRSGGSGGGGHGRSEAVSGGEGGAATGFAPIPAEPAAVPGSLTALVEAYFRPLEWLLRATW